MVHLSLLGMLLLLAPEVLLGQDQSTSSLDAKIVSAGDAEQEAAAIRSVNEQDSLALVALYNNTEGPNWSNNTNWLVGPVSTWHGVTVANNRVVRLNLAGNQLRRGIPALLGDLSELTQLILANNQLTGVIPATLGTLSQLTQLILVGNQLTGGIPPALGGLSQLVVLRLNNNPLGGEIPASLGTLSQLTELNLANNQLTGSIPAALGTLSQLTTLNLDNNQLTGGIPVALGALSQLTQLNLANNQLTGEIPASQVTLSQLTTLNLDNNQLTGSIPAALGNLSQLTTLNLGDNQLTGEIPAALGTLSLLTTLNLDNNQLTGSIPAALRTLSQLTVLNLSTNQFVDLPNMRSNGSAALNTLRVENNRLTFEDIEPNIGLPIEYSPQARVGTARQEAIEGGGSLELNVSVGGSRNVYQWLKDGSAIAGATTDTYTITSASDADVGEYVLQITNTLAVDLTLQSEPIQITVRSALPSTLTYEVSLNFGDPTRQTNYRLVALPGDDTVPLASTVAGQPPADWRAFWDNGTEGEPDTYLVEHNGSATFNFRPGRGFWLLSKNAWSSAKTIPTVTLSGNDTYAIDVHPGWNIISNPLGVDVSWSDVLAKNGLGENTPLYRFQSSFSTTSTFVSAVSSMRGEAFYFNNSTGLNQLEIPYPGLASVPARTPVPRPSQVLTLSVYREGVLASSVRVGLAKEAAPGPDMHDQVAPPGHFEAASLRLVNEAFTGPRTAWASEFRPLGREGEVFDLVLDAPKTTPVTLEVEGLEAFPESEVFLEDRRLSRFYNVREQKAVVLTASSEPGRYRLIIGRAAFVAEIREASLPETFALFSNYPNPFNPATTIEYTVPASTSGEVVRLVVYDVLGRRMRVLVDGPHEPGFYRVVWDGTNEAGAPVASGVYLYRLQAGRFGQIRRMLLMK